jgi:acyl-coenzyme A synthetase/AMP-(fatty) acid ligase
VNGRVSVRGRSGFVINTGGEKLWPEDLEAALVTLAGVRDVAVTGVSDPEWGQRVVALVVSDGSLLDDAIGAIAIERIGPWAKPKEIRYVAAIPRTRNGKIRRAELANLL